MNFLCHSNNKNAKTEKNTEVIFRDLTKKHQNPYLLGTLFYYYLFVLSERIKKKS